MKGCCIILLVWAWAMTPMALCADTAPSTAPTIASLIKPKIYKQVMEDREIQTHADLSEIENSPKPMQHYEIYAVMLVRAEQRITRQILTDYALYEKMIPYVDHSRFTAAMNLLEIEGGIWKFRMRSWIHFEEKSDSWTHFVITNGNFAGLRGDIFFESQGEKGTLVYFRGAQDAVEFPPKFVIEKGAEIVFGFTARRMRSYIEEQKNSATANPAPSAIPGAPADANQIPQPRNHL